MPERIFTMNLFLCGSTIDPLASWELRVPKTMYCLLFKGMDKWLTQGWVVETVWMESGLKPLFFWFHILWAIIEHKLFPHLKLSVKWKYKYCIYWKKKKNLHVSWTHTVQTPSKVNCKLFLSFHEMFIKQFLIMYCSGARLPVVASHLLWQTSSVTFGKLFKLTSHKIFKTVPGT